MYNEEERNELIRILSVPIYPRIGADPAEVVADYLLDNNIRPVRKGHWIDNGRNNHFTCSCCGSGCLLNYESDFHESDYCPHCGAIMIKEIDENGI